jgi:hypothetical protein
MGLLVGARGTGQDKFPYIWAIWGPDLHQHSTNTSQILAFGWETSAFQNQIPTDGSVAMGWLKLVMWLLVGGRRTDQDKAW